MICIFRYSTAKAKTPDGLLDKLCLEENRRHRHLDGRKTRGYRCPCCHHATVRHFDYQYSVPQNGEAPSVLVERASMLPRKAAEPVGGWDFGFCLGTPGA
ncbi:conserved hypothetical protein [Agrobacterium fabacearum S56]|nr:conserved hypothetical protein [Agrobacterium fabacearum S56]